jgi:hypothetical protein
MPQNLMTSLFEVISADAEKKKKKEGCKIILI